MATAKNERARILILDDDPEVLRERLIDVLVRPFALEELIAAVNNLLDAVRVRGSAAP